jgi:hypothetical protein
MLTLQETLMVVGALNREAQHYEELIANPAAAKTRAPVHVWEQSVRRRRALAAFLLAEHERRERSAA